MPRSNAAAEVTKQVNVIPDFHGAVLMMAASPNGTGNGRVIGKNHMNGKIDRPRLAKRARISRLDMERVRGDIIPPDLQASMVAVWDFSKGIDTETITDTSAHLLHGETSTCRYAA